MHTDYDFIGDIHGHADELHALLGQLGYARSGGVWRHPERTAVFLGDFIDRGPKQVEVLETVRGMVEEGAALAVMGNHEFNALCWVREDPRRPGEMLRPHDEDRTEQHQGFLDQVGDGSARHTAALDWFLTLPMWLDLPTVRVIHACWNPEILARVATRAPGGRFTEDFLLEAGSKGTQAFDDVEVLLKGMEKELPEGLSFQDKGGKERTAARLRWWNEDGTTLRETAFLDGDLEARHGHLPFPFERPALHDPRPCFVGHYWMKGTPRIQSPRVACVDYSVARSKGRLAAYRFRGETELHDGGFHAVERMSG